MRAWLLALLLSIWACAAQAQSGSSDTSKVYTGTAGGQPIAMILDGADGTYAYGNYFYRKYRFDIAVPGEWKRDTLELKAFTNGDLFRLKKSGSGLAGSLTTGKGRTVAVKLSPAKRDAATAKLSSIELYQHLRFDGLKLQKGRLETRNGKSIRWYSEPVTRMRLFRIESGYSPAATAAMNATLERRHWDHVARYFDCSGWEGGTGIDTAEASDPYLSDKYVSYAWNEAWSCAGTAHPDFGLDGQTFDARTGKEISLDDLLWFGPKVKRNPDSTEWLDYRSDVFGPGLTKLLTRLHPAEMAPEQAEDECDYSDSDSWNFGSWYLTPKGLYVGAYFARVVRMCDNPEWSIIPFSDLGEQQAPAG